MLPMAGIDEGMKIAERLRSHRQPAAHHPAPTAAPRKPSPCPAASRPSASATTSTQLIGLADAALALAKQGGRNRVVISPERA